MHTVLRHLFAGFALLASTPAFASDQFDIPLSNTDVEIPVSRYVGDKPELPLFLWLPGHRGIAPPQHDTAQTLADLGYEVWIVDLHTGYFVDTGPRSLDTFLPQDIAELIAIAAEKSGRDIIVMSRGRASRVVLNGIRAHQLATEKQGEQIAVIGSILFSPQLIISPAAPGEKAKYRPIAKASNTAIYQIQPMITTTQWRKDEVAEVLRSGGATVYLQPLPGIQGGFHLRPDVGLSQADLSARAELPSWLERAAKILAKTPRATAAAPLADDSPATKAAQNNHYGLKPLAPRAANFNLPALDGKTHSLKDHRGKLTLISFWTSWCAPSLRELPSFKRLYDDYHAMGLDIVTINASESPEIVREAVQKFAMQGYTNLLDHEGAEVKNWNVYGFPTNFLVNPKGEMIYGSFGAIEWDEPEVRALIDSLL